VNKELLLDFADYKCEEKRIKEKLDELKVAVLEELQNAEADEVSLDVGTITLVPKRTYTYPVHIQEAEAALKAMKKEAEQKGDATYEDSPYVKFSPAKAAK